MKTTKRGLAFLLSVCMLLSLAGCGLGTTDPTIAEETVTETPVADAALYIPGIYRGQGTGNGGPLYIDVTVDENSITDVVLADHNETPAIGGVALERWAAELLENQNLDAIDTISGATNTYRGFMAAAQSAIDQAMGKSDGPVVETEDITVETDVVVLGSGIAGMTAAVSAAESGVKVVVIEKRDTYGTSGHSITACNTKWQREAGYEDSPEALKDYWWKCGTALGCTTVKEDMLMYAAEHSAETMEWLTNQGVEFVGCTMAPTNPFQDPFRTHVTKSFRDGQSAYIIPLYNKAVDLGVEFYFSSTATDLLQSEDGSIVGAVANNSARTITVNADAVVLATGGYRNNKEMIAEHNPLFTLTDSVGGYSTGDGQRMAEAVGANMVYNGGSISFFINVDGIAEDNPGISMYVSPEGKRFVNENHYFTHRAAIALSQGINTYYGIYDSENIDASTLEQAIKNGSVVKADTIEELAAALSMDEATFVSTAEKYNGFCDTGIDEEFGKPAERTGYVFDPDRENLYDVDSIEKHYTLLNKIDAAPYYAVAYTVNDTTFCGTVGGCEININTEVLNKQGEVIPGLFANGEVANAQLIGTLYPQAGTSLSFCTTYGIVAGQNAAAYALNK